MSTRFRAVLIILVGFILLLVGGSAAYLLINRMNAQNAAAQQQPQVIKSPVVVLTHDMRLGAKISAEDVVVSQVPVEVVPRDALTTTDAAIGRFIKSDMVQGEMMLQHNIADPTNNNHDLSFILSEDHVMMAFPATDLMSGENIIQRGDLIDILATYKVSAKDLNPEATPAPVPVEGPTPEPTQEKPDVNFTIDAFQKVSVTALVLDIIQGGTNPGITGSSGQNTNQTVQTSISSYLLALDPQDALVLKHLKDLNATFDVVLRSPTSKTTFDLTPVEEQYIIELYRLRELP